MYKLEFGQSEKRTAYIYEVNDDGSFANQDSFSWTKLTGAVPAVTMLLDEEGGSDYFPGQITKQSVKLSLYRTNDNPSVMDDLILGEDNNWRIVIVSGDYYLERTSLGGVYYPQVSMWSFLNGSILFYGFLTNETYGEDYKANANINLTFHDRLGELKEVTFEPAQQYLTVTELLNQILDGLPLTKFLRIEFPYLINGSAANPKDVLLDVAKFYGKKRGDVLKAFLKDFGLNLYIDYGVANSSGSVSTPDRIQRCGVVTIRHWGKFQEVEHTYYRFEKQDGVYEYIEEEVIYSVPKFMPQDYKIVAYGSWDLVRRAKFLLAKSNYEIRSNVIYPPSLSLDTLTPVDRLRNYATFDSSKYDYYSTHWRCSGWIWSWLSNPELKGECAVGKVGDSQKLGLKLVDRFKNPGLASPEGRFIMSKPALVIKGDEKFSLMIEVFSVKQMDIRFALLAYSPTLNAYKQFRSTVFGWESFDEGSGNPTTWIAINDISTKKYVSNIFSEIPQPDFDEGDSYYISVYITYADDVGGQAGTFITECKLMLDTELALPPSLTIRTNISETRRSPIEEEFTFINLPLIGNDQSFYYNGMYYRDPSTGDISAPETIGYGGNEATLLVHQSELIGGQMTAERWAFKAKILEAIGESEEQLIIANWITALYVCETDSDENTGYQRRKAISVSVSAGGEQVSYNEYLVTDAIPETSFEAITDNQLAALSLNDYNDRLAAFRAYVSSVEGLNVASYETNLARVENTTACPIPPAEIYSLTLTIHPDSTGVAGVLTKDPDKPLYYKTELVTINAADNAPNGFFRHWEKFGSGGWEPYSLNATEAITVTTNMQFRAFYSDMAQ